MIHHFMPYIVEKTRHGLKNRHPVNAGELNYILTTTINNYLIAKGVKYETINAVLGALEGAKLEFYRRIAAPYEDLKIESNGDVYSKHTL